VDKNFFENPDPSSPTEGHPVDIKLEETENI